MKKSIFFVSKHIELLDDKGSYVLKVEYWFIGLLICRKAKIVAAEARYSDVDYSF